MTINSSNLRPEELPNPSIRAGILPHPGDNLINEYASGAPITDILPTEINDE